MTRAGESGSIDRRCFLRWSALLGSTALASPLVGDVFAAPWAGGDDAVQALPDGSRIVRAGCPSHNCGGRCLLKLHVRNGRIVRIESDDRPGDSLELPQLRACVRGRAYRRRQYHPDRLLHPLKRTGPRGTGAFQRITWDEALDRVAGEIARVREKYGNAALFVPYGTGSYSQINGR